MNRHIVAQVVLFALISVVAIGYGIAYIREDADVARGFRVVAGVEDARGVGPGIRVTYRGVDVGEVQEAVLDGDGGVRLHLRILDGTLIPVDAHARVVTSTALGDTRLDVRPRSGAGPYLADGGELLVPEDEQPAALEDLIAEIDTSLRAVDPASLASFGDSVATALEGNGPRLGAILEDTARLAAVLGERAPTFRGLVGDGLVTVRALAEREDPVTGSARVARDVTGQLARREDTLVYLLDRSPDAMVRAQELLDANRDDAAGLLGNALVVTPVFRDRGPAWEAGLTQGERGLRALAGQAQAATELKAPFNGKVVRVASAAGQPLKAGETAVVIESMKLEHSVAPRADVTVAEVLVADGQQVTPGQVLLRFEVPTKGQGDAQAEPVEQGAPG